MSLEASDAEAAAVATAPRVTLADMEAKVVTCYTFTAAVATAHLATRLADIAALNVLTICVCVLDNGWTLVGKSAPASPENFNAELGAKFAYEDCIRQLWPLEGYLLRNELHSDLLERGTGTVRSVAPE